MKIKNRRWHKKRYLETNILNSVSKGKILKQVDIKVPEKYLKNKDTFAVYDIENHYNIKVLKMFYALKDKSYYITILNKNEYEKQIKEMNKNFHANIIKSGGGGLGTYQVWINGTNSNPINDMKEYFKRHKMKVKYANAPSC